MNTKKTIKRILFVAMWLTIGTGMLTLLIAAMGKQKKDSCKDYVIRIKATTGGDFFLDEADILKLLKAATNGKIKGQPKSSFNLQRMERLLEDNQWVKEAQLYFDNKDVLHVSVTEHEPIARLFTTKGNSFYLDENGQLMGLSDKLSASLPVFTGFPDKKILTEKDSALRQDVIKTATFISTHPFWSSQVAQIDIADAPTTDFDMVPVVGNHIVKLGNGDNIEDKFNRLYTFYKQVLSKSGLDRYKAIDVRFAGQVIGRKSDNPKVDSVQLRKNVEQLLRQIEEMEKLNDAEAKLPTAVPMQPLVAPNDTLPHAGEENIDQPIVNPPPVGTTRTNPKPPETPRVQTRPSNSPPAREERRPRAVMPRREN